MAEEVVNIAEENGGISLLAADEGSEGCSSCDGNCSGGCSGSCSGSCKGNCKGNCKGTCQKVCLTGNGNKVINVKSTVWYGPDGDEPYDNTEYTCPFSTSDFVGGNTIQNILSADIWNTFITRINNNIAEGTEYSAPRINIRVASKDIIADSNVRPVLNTLEQLNNNSQTSSIQGQLITAQFFKDLISKFNNIEYYYRTGTSCKEVGNVEHPEPYVEGGGPLCMQDPKYWSD